MEYISTIAELNKVRNNLHSPLGLVPTMGALHHGHLSLIRRAKSENASVIVTIFINPTQFKEGEDYQAYPKLIESDLSILRKEKVDIAFVPPVAEMYPHGFDSWVEVQKMGHLLEGASRSQHFKGVATIVTKIFNIIRPNKAYFGQKDGQQALIIKQLNRDLNLCVDIVINPTVREHDGLAYSSRNINLSLTERNAATILFKSLEKARKVFLDGDHNAKRIKIVVSELIKCQPLAKLDYISVADAQTLQELTEIDRPTMISLAAFIGNTRLIDNILI